MVCESYISQADLKSCSSAPAYKNLTIGNTTSGCVWSCADLALYCHAFLDYLKLNDMSYSKLTEALVSYVFPFGFIGNCLLFMILFSKKLSGSTFVFLQIIAGIQVFQGFLFLVGAGKVCPEAANISCQTIALQLSYCIKLFLCVVSLSLTFDRYLAFCRSTKYAKADRRKLYLICLLVSFIPASIDAEYFAEFGWRPYVLNNRSISIYTVDRTSPWYGYHSQYVSAIVLALRLAILVLMSFFAIEILRQIRRRARRITTIAMADTAKREHANMVSLCRFQMVDTVAMVIDIAFSCSLDIMHIFRPPTSFNRCSMDENMRQLNYDTVNSICQIILQINMAFAHGELLLIYLALFRKFRQASLHLLRSGYSRVTGRIGVTGAASKTGVTGTTSRSGISGKG